MLELRNYAFLIRHSYAMQQQRGGGVKSLMEIQAEEARKAHQQGQLKQQQYRQQQQQQQQQKVQSRSDIRDLVI